MALYTDRAHWAFHTPKAKGPVDKTRVTQVGRALARLGIEHIPAYSPQARGRSERLNRTFQDRLVNELRVAGIATLETANQYLVAHFVPQTTPRLPGRPATRRVPLCHWATLISMRFSATKRTAWSPPTIRSHSPGECSRSRRSPGGGVVRAARHRAATLGRALHDHARDASARLLPGRRPACGSCRGRGRQARAHRPLENAQIAFSQLPHASR